MTTAIEAADVQRRAVRVRARGDGWKPWMWRLIVWGGLIVAWAVAAAMRDSILFPGPGATASAIGNLFSEGHIQTILASLRQLFIGFGLAVVVGVPLGLLMGSARLADDFLSPYVNTLFIVSKEALLPLFIVMFGTHLVFRIVVVFVFAVFLIIINTAAGVRTVDSRLIETAQAFGLKRRRIFTQIVLPASLPFVISSLRIGFGLALKGMVIAELWVTVGVGQLLSTFAAFLRTDMLFAVTVVIVAIAVICTEGIAWFERRVRRWARTGTVTATGGGYWLSDAGNRPEIRWAVRALAVALFFIAWELVGLGGHYLAIVPAHEVVARMFQDIFNGTLITAALGTIKIAVIGYVLGGVAGVLLGSLIGLSRIGRWTLDPLVHAGNAAPMTVMIPILAIWFGFAIGGKIVLVFLFVVFIVAVNTAAGVSQAPATLLETARAFGVRGSRLYTKVVFPNALPAIMTGLRIGVARAIQGAILADLLLQAANLGGYLLTAGAALDMEALLAGILLVVLIGTGAMSGARWLESRIVRG
jgi:ABC-type nitrate/sulfonate/bicarbonate transport system permease component